MFAQHPLSFDFYAEAYRQRLSRIRKTVAAFLSDYCGLSGTGGCNCQKRVGYAIKNHRLNPKNLEYSSLKQLSNEETEGFVQAMEEMDQLSSIFANLPKYRSPENNRAFLEDLLSSGKMNIIKGEA